MPLKHSFIKIVTIALLAVIWSAGETSRAAADEYPYPWCRQGGTLRCYYMNREQCEETVDYHGFCVPNPEYQSRQ
jgi:hypothetical protein